jgi:hypothetical protein
MRVMSVNHKGVVLLTAGLMVLCQLQAQFTAGDTTDQQYESDVSVSRHPDAITYRGHTPRLRKIEDPSGEYCSIVLPGHHFTSETGKPELPVYSRLVDVPQGMKVKVVLSGILVSKIKFAEQGLGDAQIYPSQPARTKNEAQDQKVVVKDRKTYESKGTISHDTVVMSTVGTFRGHELVNIAIYPAFYDPAGGYVDLISSMNVNISYIPSDTKGITESTGTDDKSGYASDSYITGYTDRPVNMIIVADSIFIRHLQPLLRWKLLKGIKTTVIYKRPGPADTVYSDLKTRISTAYSSMLDNGNPPQYLLIVGDPALIPTARGISNVSDLYYGEFDGAGDYIPELFIGRLPVSDTTQLKAVVKKIIDYETLNYAPANNFWSGALVTAGNAPGFENYMNGQVGYIYNNYFSKEASLSAHRWKYPESAVKDDSLKLLFNQGLSILNYTGHGEASGFSDPVFKVPNVSGLTNNNEYPLIIANACRTAQINVASCFGTAMVNASDKGAVGYIGCTNDSYWVEDFFWAVGPGNPGTDVTYENTGAGAFDRLFHTHGELPGEWYYTMGQINFAGNMAVSASTSQRKKYYWETYMLLGDPSMTPLIGRPDTFNIELPDTVPQFLNTLSFFTTPFAYAALSDFDTLWDAKSVSPSGSISLKIPTGVKDSCLLIITGQNMVPFHKVIHFGPVAGAFITVKDIVFDDSGGNNNGAPDYGERIRLKITVRNLGQGASVGLGADLSVLSGQVTLENTSALIGVLAPGASYTINTIYFNVSDEAKDGELASLLLNLSDTKDEYLFGIDMTLRAPELRIISSVHDDSMTGNSNFLPEPGETIILNVRVKNEGSSATSGIVSVSNAGSGGPLQIPDIETGTLGPGAEKVLGFEVTISNQTLPGTIIPYDIKFVCGKYETQGRWTISIGKTRETWEFERFDVFPWIQKIDYPWTITSLTSFENVKSARSAIIPNKAESVLSIYVNNPVRDTVSFYSLVSSEADFDTLVFRVDSVNVFELSGDIPWTQRQSVLKPGVHYLEWVYKKDVSLTGGLDAAWIDQVSFPDISFLEADLKIDTVFPPLAAEQLNSITVKGRVVNLGRTTLTSFPLAYRINESEPVSETFFLKTDPGDTVDVYFTKKCILLADHSYLIYILSQLPEDGYAGNDTAYTSFIRSDAGPDLNEESVRLLPNPFRETFIIEIDATDADRADIALTDLSGRVVLRSSEGLVPGSNRITVDGSRLAGGAYMLSVTIGNKTLIMKVLKVS